MFNKRCPSCGGKMPLGSLNCSSCGHRIELSDAQFKPRAVPYGLMRKSYVLAPFFFIGLAFALAYLVRGGSVVPFLLILLAIIPLLLVCNWVGTPAYEHLVTDYIDRPMLEELKESIGEGLAFAGEIRRAGASGKTCGLTPPLWW